MSAPGVPQCVGRGGEIAAVRSALATGAAGVPTALIILGDAGMGKSTLLATVLPASGDTLVLSAAGDEAETDVDFGVIEQLVRDAPLAGAERSRFVPPAGTDPLEAGALLLRAFDELELDRPLVLALDDAHLADAPSLQALTFAARRLRGDRVVLLVATRTDGASRLPPGLRRLAGRTGGELELNGLDTAAVSELVAAVHGAPLPLAAAERLRAHTDGHPLHTRVLLEQLRPGDLLRAGELPAPRSFSSLVVGQVAACSDAAQRLVMALSVFAGPAPLADVAAIAGVESPLGAADELSALGLVTTRAGLGGIAVAFRHSLTRASVYGGLSASRRTGLHAAAAMRTTGAAALHHRHAAATGPDDALARD
ncbi:MAG: AAA family ATPase, partial [Candidatus Limnocylindrales bacterium]